MIHHIIPTEAFMDLSDIEHSLYRIQNEGDAHSNAIATLAMESLQRFRDQVVDQK